MNLSSQGNVQSVCFNLISTKSLLSKSLVCKSTVYYPSTGLIGLSPINAIGQELFTEGVWRAALLYDLKTFYTCCVLDREPWLDTKVKFFLQALFFILLRRSKGCADAHLHESSKCLSWPCSPPLESRTSLRRIIKTQGLCFQRRSITI